MPSPPSAPDFAWRFLATLHRLVTLLAAPDADPAASGEAMLAMDDLAREDRLDVRVRALAEHPARAAHPGAAELVAGLHQAGVRRLVVRRGATGRELAQFAGLLARVRAEAARDGRPDGERRAAARAAIGRGLDELGIWSVQVGALEAPRASRVAEAVPALPPAVRDAMDARDADAVAAAYAAVHAALGGVAGRFGDALRDAAVVAAALGDLVRHVAGAGARWDPPARAAHHAALAALVEPWTETVVGAAVDGALFDAAPVLRLAAERAVPLLLHRLGDASTLEERRRCFGALLDAAGGVGPLLAGLHDERWFVVRNVALLLGELRDADAVRPLARCLAAAADARVRAAAAEALERIGTAGATHALLPALRDAAPAVRLVAARAARRAPAQQVPVHVGMLAARLRVEADVAVASELLAALAALAAAGDAEAAAAVVRAAARRVDAPDGELLARAAFARLLEQPAARLGAALRPLAVGDGDPTLRMATRGVLARLARARQGAAG